MTTNGQGIMNSHFFSFQKDGEGGKKSSSFFWLAELACIGVI